jgi:hypothetical protein
MVFNTLPPTTGAGGAITSPHLKKGASPLPNPPSPVKNQDFRGPDFFVALGVSRRERKSLGVLGRRQNAGCGDQIIV